MSSYVRARVNSIAIHTNDLKSLTLRLDYNLTVAPGQFVMVWLPDYEEIPISPSHSSHNYMRLTIKAVGETSRALINMNVGDELYIRGPYGRGFNLEKEGKYLLVGGGYGAAPVIYAARRLTLMEREILYVEGVKTREESLFYDEAKNIGIDAVLVTEDGSSGIKGMVTDYVANIIDDYDILLACGPEPMLDKLYLMALEHGIDAQLSYERIVKCGIGLCGSCVIEGTGLLVCMDGPVFTVEELRNSSYEVAEHA